MFERLLVLVVRLLQSSTVRCVFYLLVFGRLSTMLVNVGGVFPICKLPFFSPHEGYIFTT